MTSIPMFKNSLPNTNLNFSWFALLRSTSSCQFVKLSLNILNIAKTKCFKGNRSQFSSSVLLVALKKNRTNSLFTQSSPLCFVLLLGFYIKEKSGSINCVIWCQYDHFTQGWIFLPHRKKYNEMKHVYTFPSSG